MEISCVEQGVLDVLPYGHKFTYLYRVMNGVRFRYVLSRSFGGSGLLSGPPSIGLQVAFKYSPPLFEGSPIPVDVILQRGILIEELWVGWLSVVGVLSRERAIREIVRVLGLRSVWEWFGGKSVFEGEFQRWVPSLTTEERSLEMLIWCPLRRA